MERSEYTQGGVLTVAPGLLNNVVPASVARLVVRVRDRSGTPLPGATVTATLGGHARPAPPTDAQGRTELDLSAGNWMIEATMAIHTPNRPAPNAPWPSFRADSQRVALVGGQTFLLTLMPDVTHFPRHRFQWQNKFIRQSLYSGSGGEDSGGGTAGTAPGTRKTRLGVFLELYGQLTRGTTPDHVRVGTHPDDYASYSAQSHTQIMQSVFQLFASDRDATLVPVWLRYMILHFSGMRYNDQRSTPPAAPHGHGHAPAPDAYTCAHNTYVEPFIYVARLRINDLLTEIDNTPPAHIPELCEELAEMLPLTGTGRHAALVERVTGVNDVFNAHQPSGIFATPTGDAATLVQALRDPAYRGNPVELVKRLSGALAWTLAQALSEEQALGILMARMAIPLPPTDEAVWKRIVGRTRLRYDVVAANWLLYEHEHGPAAPLSNIVAPSGYLYAFDFWKTHQARNLEPMSASAVCNEITEMGAAARGISLPGGIPRDAAACRQGIRPTLPDPPPAQTGTAPAPDSAQAVAPPAPTGDAAAPAPASPDPADGSYVLFRFRDANDLRNVRPGSLLFFCGWKPIVATTSGELLGKGVLGSFIPKMERFAVRATQEMVPAEPRLPRPSRSGHGGAAGHRGARGGAATTAAPAPPPADAAPTTPTMVSEDQYTTPIFYNPDEHMSRDPVTGDYAALADLQVGSGTPATASPKRTPILKFEFTYTTRVGREHVSVTDFVLVRRKTTEDLRYNEVFYFTHISTAVKQLGSRLLTFETAGPTGLTTRPLRSQAPDPPSSRLHRTDGGLTGPGVYVATPPAVSLPRLPHGATRPDPPPIREELYAAPQGHPLVPRQEQLATQEREGGMLFRGTADAPGFYDED